MMHKKTARSGHFN